METNGINMANISKASKVVRISKNCVGCGHCVPFCPLDAIAVYGMASISEEKCTSCGRCISYCPNDAIREVYK